jgi:hypothetical protein
MSTQQPLKGNWVYSYNLSKQLFVDEHGRILDPSATKIPLPQRVVAPTVQSTTVQDQTQAAAPVQKQQQPPVQRAQRRQTQRQTVPQRPRTAMVPATANIVPAQRQINQNNGPRATTAPAPAPSQWTRVTKTGNITVPNRNNNRPAGNRNTSRATRSASVSSSGSSVRSRSNTTFVRYPSYYLNRKAVVRSGPSLNTRVKVNLEAGTEITTDEVHTRTIFYNGNLRKRIKIIKPEVGWVTVETEQGKLYGRKHYNRN